MKYKNICCVTGSRAEYGIFKPLLEKFKHSHDFKLEVIATGSHFSEAHGSSIEEIKRSFDITREINSFKNSDSKQSKITEMSDIQSKFADYLRVSKTDLVMIIGDRYEILPIAISSYMRGVPIAHIHGGEETKGSLDNGIRHAISHLSELHFTSTEEYSNRLKRMGIDPDKVVNVGALGIERAHKHKSKTKKEVEKDLKIKFGLRNIICTIHPPTLENLDIKKLIDNLVLIFDSYEDLKVIFTGANADHGGIKINSYLEKVVANDDNFYFYKSLGESSFFDVLNIVDLMIGNSSSAILEAPSFKLPAVNIGSRQDGRILGSNVFNAKPNLNSMRDAMKKGFAFKESNSFKNFFNPYGNGDASTKIINYLRNS